MDERERRVGLNEAVFRQVNERIEELNQAFGSITETMQVICECGDAGCIAQITMSVPEYDELRRDPRRFAVVPGHEDEAVERVVERHDAYDVVEKDQGPPTEIAERTDTRS
jgi:hypothetical protein